MGGAVNQENAKNLDRWGEGIVDEGNRKARGWNGRGPQDQNFLVHCEGLGEEEGTQLMRGLKFQGADNRIVLRREGKKGRIVRSWNFRGSATG